MIKKLLLASCCSVFALSMNAQTPSISNPSMETWLTVSGALSLERPENFHGSDSTLRAMAPLIGYAGYPITPKKQVFKSSDAHAGDFSARVVTTNLGTSFGNTPGVLANGPIEVNLASAGSLGSGASLTDILKVRGGTAILGRKVDSVVSYVKCPTTNTDSAIIIVNAMRNVGGTMTVIGSGTTVIAPAADYQRISVSVEYLSDTMLATDSLSILYVSSYSAIAPSGTTPIFGFTENNEIFVDNLSLFTSVPTGITSPFTSKDLGITAYPVPANHQIHFNNANNLTETHLAIYDIQGRVLYSKAMKEGINTLDIAQWPAGYYVYEVIDTKHQLKQTGKFSK